MIRRLAASDDQNHSLTLSVTEAIGVGRRINAIVLRGSPEHIAWLKEKNAAIDVPVESVSLETMFVEPDEPCVKNIWVVSANAIFPMGVAIFQMGPYGLLGVPLGDGLSGTQL